jgi:UDP:flavonoid glycosyltransferase YjiC (YdhE family)
MRVLISTRLGAGHIGPMIPFAHALLRNNDEVIVTAPASGAAMIADAGLDHHPIPDPPEEQRTPIFAKARSSPPTRRTRSWPAISSCVSTAARRFPTCAP